MTEGRVAALFYLGYELLAAYIRHHALHLLVSFMNRLIGYLIQFLAGSRFYRWLEEQGGWVSEMCTTHMYTDTPCGFG